MKKRTRSATRRRGPDAPMVRAFKRLRLRPGDIYESCGFHPVLCLGVDYKQDDVWGISLIDGSYPHSCSLVLCGLRRLSLKQARDIKLRGPDSPDDRARMSPERRWWVEGADAGPLRISFATPRGLIASDVRATAASMYRSGTLDKQTFREIEALTRPGKGSRKRALPRDALDAKRVRESSRRLAALGSPTMKKKSERLGRASHDPDDAPEITQEWVNGANLYRGKKLIRRGAGASPPSVAEIRERLARRPAVVMRVAAAEALRRERKRR